MADAPLTLTLASPEATARLAADQAAESAHGDAEREATQALQRKAAGGVAPPVEQQPREQRQQQCDATPAEEDARYLEQTEKASTGLEAAHPARDLDGDEEEEQARPEERRQESQDRLHRRNPSGRLPHGTGGEVPRWGHDAPPEGHAAPWSWIGASGGTLKAGPRDAAGPPAQGVGPRPYTPLGYPREDSE